ncbi:hypothetical protein BA763_13425 [Burkholderia cenocepacia]|nr:hypothetical protein BA763_13425 [Burkholderia cenocepacia]
MPRARPVDVEQAHDAPVEQVVDRERAAHQRDALALDRGQQQVRRILVQDPPFRLGQRIEPGRVEPRPPQLVVRAQQWVVHEIGGRLRQLAAIQRRRAGRKEHLLEQRLHVQPRIAAEAEADRQIDVVAREIGERVGRLQFDVDFRMPLDERADARRDEARGERRQHRHHQPPVAVARAHVARRVGDHHQRGADLLRVPHAGVGQAQPLAVAREQLHAELFLERAHLVADRAVRDEQLVGGAREVLVARGGFERANRVQRGELAEVHLLIFLTST